MRGAILLAGLVLVACGGDKGTNPATLEGTYQLQTVNGAGLPGVLVNDPANSYTASLTTGSLTINGGSTYSNALTLREVDHGTVTTTDILCTGTFTRTGNSLSFTEATSAYCGGSYTGSWDGNRNVTVAYDASTQAVYHR